MSYNRVILHGNLTRDPELSYIPNGTAVAKFGIAVNRKWKDANEEEKEEVTFVDIECWSKQAEVIAQYFKKGSQMLLEGRLKLDSWEDKATHENRHKLKVVLERFSFVGSRSDNPDNVGGNGKQPHRKPPGRGGSMAEAPQQDAADTGYQPDPEESESVPF